MAQSPQQLGGSGVVAPTEILVKSHNFEFLRERASTLVDIVALAEKYWYSDPESSAVKLRAFAEGVVEGLYAIQNFPRPYDANLNDLLRERLFHDSTPKVVLDHLHLLRKLGNKGAHGNPVRANEALRGLEDAFAVAKSRFIQQMRERTTRLLKSDKIQEQLAVSLTQRASRGEL